MTTPKDHYDRLLATHYTWMFGVPFEQKVEEQTTLLRKAGIQTPGLCVDLGCGPGFQSLALARMGASRVHAVDTSGRLLAELKEHAAQLEITTHETDLLTFIQQLVDPVDTIVCMGDTLTHLASLSDVEALFVAIARQLNKGGRFVLSWRDLSKPPEGVDRFIPLRSEHDRLMVCFLEDQGDTVLAHDLVHVWEKDGWQLYKSAYPKLKLSPDWVRNRLAAVGLIPCYENTVRGMTMLTTTRSR